VELYLSVRQIAYRSGLTTKEIRKRLRKRGVKLKEGKCVPLEVADQLITEALQEGKHEEPGPRGWPEEEVRADAHLHFSREDFPVVWVFPATRGTFEGLTRLYGLKPEEGPTSRWITFLAKVVVFKEEKKEVENARS